MSTETPRPQAMRWKTARKIAGLLALLFIVVIALGAFHVSRSLPRVDGEIAAPGLDAPVEMVRDAHGVPHIFAKSETDAYFSLGYVHAQDRLWQMEMHRRFGAGRLSEIFGKVTLDQDRLSRTLGLALAAEQDLAALDPKARAIVDAYARGVNALLAEDRVLPPEFLLLRAKPSPWTAVDCVVWTKVMALGLAGNFQQELARLALADKLSPKQLADLFAPYPGDAPVILPDTRTIYGSLGTPARAIFGALPRHDDVALGSNNWAVDGTHTASGKPLLANDPHLELSAPATWYLAHLSAPGLDVIGATIPGMPAVVLGRNDRVAWAFTNTESDAQDLYVEKLAQNDAYVTPSGTLPLSSREERIVVKGEADVVLRVRSTRHGPVVSDLPDAKKLPDGHVMALRWTALEPGDRTLEFSHGAARARDAGELLEATRHFRAPQQNIVYADVDGAIGFIAAGLVPIRAADNDLRGLVPAPGWISRYDWQGFVPWDKLPRTEKPPSGVLVTANQKITDADYPYPLSLEWSQPYRADRIRALLGANDKHTRESFARIQLDTKSGTAETLLPLLLTMTPREGLRDEESALAGRLERWNHEMSRDAAEPLIFGAWVRELAREIYGDELGDLFPDFWAERIEFLSRVLSDVDGEARWCDDVRTPEVEGCGAIALRSLRAAAAYLKNAYGSDASRWSWGAAHPARSAHAILGEIPLLRSWANIESPASGDNETVNLAGYAIGDAAGPFVARSGPALRAIYDFADLERSTFVLSTGQSGNPLSPLYRDQARLWSAGEQIPMHTERASIDREKTARLALVPSTSH